MTKWSKISRSTPKQQLESFCRFWSLCNSLCREDLVKPLRHPTPLRHVHPWDIDGNDDANEYRRFNLGGTVNFWFVNRGLTLLLKAVPLRAILVSWAKSSMLIELQTTLRKRFAIYFSVCTFFMFACRPFPRANSLSKWSKIFIE